MKSTFENVAETQSAGVEIVGKKPFVLYIGSDHDS